MVLANTCYYEKFHDFLTLLFKGLYPSQSNEAGLTCW